MDTFAAYVDARDMGLSDEKCRAILKRSLFGRNEWYGGSANDPSNVEDEGDGTVDKHIAKPGAFPVYSSDELPVTARNRKSKVKFMSKDSRKAKVKRNTA